MTNHDEKPENNPSDPVEPNAESIIIGFGRGSYSGVNDAEESPLLFERFLDQSKGPSEPYPDIDGNFVDGDRKRKEFLDTLSDFYGNKEQDINDTTELNATLYKILYP